MSAIPKSENLDFQLNVRGRLGLYHQRITAFKHGYYTAFYEFAGRGIMPMNLGVCLAGRRLTMTWEIPYMLCDVGTANTSRTAFTVRANCYRSVS